jgi:hypothetical protein
LLLLLLLLQVDLGGQQHSLFPIQIAAKAAHVFTQPTVYRSAVVS